jgi:hypothetical protein
MVNRACSRVFTCKTTAGKRQFRGVRSANDIHTLSLSPSHPSLQRSKNTLRCITMWQQPIASYGAMQPRALVYRLVRFGCYSRHNRVRSRLHPTVFGGNSANRARARARARAQARARSKCERFRDDVTIEATETDLCLCLVVPNNHFDEAAHSHQQKTRLRTHGAKAGRQKNESARCGDWNHRRVGEQNTMGDLEKPLRVSSAKAQDTSEGIVRSDSAASPTHPQGR